MSDDRQPVTHDTDIHQVTGGAVGVSHGPLTIINEAAPPHPRRRPRPHRHRPRPPRSTPLTTPIDRAAPYPLFRPYRDPAIFAGRDADVVALRRCLADEHPLIGIYAPSGYGKSSLLLAGLAPALRAAGHPTVIDREPADAGLARRLLAGLLTPAPAVADDDPDRFVAWLRRAVEHAERPLVLVLDQFEAVFKRGDDEAPRARVALLIAATLWAGLPVRWVLSYRAEFDWQIGEWLDNAHEELARCHPDCAARLPPLGRHRLHVFPVRPFGAEAPEAAFRAAIQRPLERCDWTIAPDDLNRLTALFADARRDHWQWPLVPELQVVLDHRVRSATDNTLTAPADLDTDLRIALRAHIEGVIDRLARQHPDPSIGRALIGIALRRLVDEHGRRDETGLTRSELALIVGPTTLDALEDTGARLLMVRRDEHGTFGRYTLSHDTIAAEVATLGGEGWFGSLAEADRETLRVVLGLDQRIGNLAALYAAEKTEGALVLSRDDMARIAAHQEPLLWDDTRRRWWAAARAHRRRRIRRTALTVAAAVLAVVAVAYGIWWTERQTKIDRAVAQIAAGNSVLRNLQDLIDLGHDDARIDGLIDGAELEEVEDTPDDPVEVARARFIRRRLAGGKPATTAEDFGRLIAGVEAGAHPEAQGRLDDAEIDALRAEIHAGLRARFRGEVPAIEWRPVGAGSFMMGDEGGQVLAELPVRRVTLPAFELSRTEVTIGQYRAFDEKGYERNLDGQQVIATIAAAWGEETRSRPAWMVNWYEAQAFALWLDPNGRLPTEAEWEYATRGGPSAPEEATMWWTGSTLEGLKQVAWTQENSGGLPHPVCQPMDVHRQHALGLCDVHGNLYEWVSDWLSDDYRPEGPIKGPLGTRRGALRALRGGSFLVSALLGRSAHRHGAPPNTRVLHLGFRVARSAPLNSDITVEF